MAQNPQSAYRSWLGVSKDTTNGSLTSYYPSGSNTFILTNVNGTPTNAMAVVFVDGNNTETLAVSSWTSGTSTLVTTTTSSFAHSANTYVFLQTAGAVGPTAFIPVTALDFHDDYVQLYDTGYRGSQATSYGAQQGMRLGNFSIGGDLFPDTFGYIAQSFFGAYDAVTSSSNVAVSSLSAASGSVITASVASGSYLVGQPVTFTGAVTGGSGPWSQVIGTQTVASVGAGSNFTFTIGASVGGTPTVTGASVSSPNAYSFSPQNTSNGQPNSYLFWDYNPGNSNLRVYAKAIISDLDIKLDPAALTKWTATGQAYASGVVAGTGSTSAAAASVSVPTPTFSTFTPVASRVGGTVIGGTAVPDTLTADYTLKREDFGAVNTIQGTQDPLSIFSGPVSCQVKWEIVQADDTQLNNYINQSQPSFQVSAMKSSGTAANGVFLRNTQANYEAVMVKQMGKAYVTLDGGHTGIANTTDISSAGSGYSPVRVTVATATSGTTTIY